MVPAARAGWANASTITTATKTVKIMEIVFLVDMATLPGWKGVVMAWAFPKFPLESKAKCAGQEHVEQKICRGAAELCLHFFWFPLYLGIAAMYNIRLTRTESKAKALLNSHSHLT
jgi:hypothetical protein